MQDDHFLLVELVDEEKDEEWLQYDKWALAKMLRLPARANTRGWRALVAMDGRRP